jgi:3-deoxy-D-manno-octulosonate 8-phosphate phosphatase (KDO 8-P phosphatase)
VRSGSPIPNNPSNPGLEESVRAIRLVAFDFDGVFTDNLVYVFEDGSEAVRCFRGDGIGLRKLARLGIATVIISTETNPVVSARSRKLGIRCVQACGDKRAALETIVQEMRLSLAQVAFVGNDVNDLPCLACVGLPIVVQDAHLDVLPYAQHQTRARGGYGAVREVCDLFEWVLTAKPE